MNDFIKNNWTGILVISLILLSLPIKISNEIHTFLKILPAQQFVAIKGSNGQIITHLINNVTGIVEKLETIQVDREDFASLKVNIDNPNIALGDTLATFYSSHTDLILEEMKGEILRQQKLLNSQLSGEKSSIISEQEKIYEIAKTKVINQKKIYNRKSELFNKKLISQEEFDDVKDLLNIVKLEEEKEYQKLLTFKTGSRQEDIQLTKETISNIKKQKNVIEKRINNYHIIAPFNGKILGSYSLDTLFILSDVNLYVAIIPVDIEESSEIINDNKISFIDLGKEYDIAINNMEPESKIINGKNFAIFKAEFKTDKILHNNLFECSIDREKKSLFNILKDNFINIFNLR